MQRAIIIDDEENARLTLSLLIQEYTPDVEIVAQCANVPEGVLAINKHNPDIVFLDIEMSEYNGFELLDFFKSIDFQIIFVTAYSKYAIKAFEVSATDYLLKPVEIESLKAAIKKAYKNSDPKSNSERLEILKAAHAGDDVLKLALPVSNKLVFVEHNQIVFFEADRVYTDVHLKDGTKHTVSKPMRLFEELLDNRPTFFRTHRSYFINIFHIKQYLRGESLIVMDNNKNIPISRDRKADFEILLKKLKLLI